MCIGSYFTGYEIILWAEDPAVRYSEQEEEEEGVLSVTQSR